MKYLLLLLLLSRFSVSDSVRPQRRQPTRLPRPWDPPGKNTGVGCHCLLQRMKMKSESEVTQSCPTLSDPMDCSLPGSSVHGIFQARVLEWGAIAFSNDCSGLPITTLPFFLLGVSTTCNETQVLTEGNPPTSWHLLVPKQYHVSAIVC